MTDEAAIEQYLISREDEEDKADSQRPWEQVAPLVRPALMASNGKLAIIVGHSRSSPGAWGVAPISQYEYPFNKALAEGEISAAAARRGVEIGIFYRDGHGVEGAYRQVNAYQPDAAFELHFNALSSSSSGTLTLYGSSNRHSQRLAKSIQREMLKTFGLADHGLVFRKKGDGGRGSDNVNSANCPSALLEPFFGSNPEDSKVGNAKRAAYADAIITAFLSFNKAAALKTFSAPLFDDDPSYDATLDPPDIESINAVNMGVDGAGDLEADWVSSPAPMATWTTIAFDMSKALSFLNACMNSKPRVVYGYGAKIRAGEVPGRDFISVDCSGLVRELVRRATDLNGKFPDGSFIQHEWVRDRHFKQLDRSEGKLTDGVVRIAFMKPNDSPNGIGHVAIVHDGYTLESHGGVGPNRRIWDGAGWQGKSYLYALTSTATS
ncbi:N-acetylmuramoyl-L-alanine amidase [Agrobacterium sp. 10MFCol1.1]|uniref:N-acetylmuramoyl-L-alanine amidase n=1 Tax=Agrobacterium sp. 10MFCol1.1 TaxID=1150775 RepID=UPI00037BBDB5|nr:N-acetylmuramoyl-L-alanine amidase [Agrobacterium sp. 10MFCol1.1]